MMRRRCTHIASLLGQHRFAAGLAILLLNDFYLKWHFHNWLTGKLSDVVGLYIFPLFWCHFFPQWRRHIYWAVAMLFAFWKSELAGGLIDWLNNGGIAVARVVDPTDLLALVVLPLSYGYNRNAPKVGLLQWRLAAFVSLLVFCSDSIATRSLTDPEAQNQLGAHKWAISTGLTEEEMVAKWKRQGLKYYADSVTLGAFFYDTSRYASKRIVRNPVKVTRFWRIRNYRVGDAVVKNINLRYVAGMPAAIVEVMGYDVDDPKWDGRKGKGYVGLLKKRLTADVR